MIKEKPKGENAVGKLSHLRKLKGGQGIELGWKRACLECMDHGFRSLVIAKKKRKERKKKTK